MDGFTGYNQIKMHPLKAEKTVFQTPMDNFNYTVILFGLKNATYQRAMMTIWNDCLEDYIDDSFVSPKKTLVM